MGNKKIFFNELVNYLGREVIRMPSKSIPSNHWKLNAFYNQTFIATMKLLKQSRVPTTELFQSCKVYDTQSLAAKACV